MTSAQLLLASWDWPASEVVGCAGLLVAYGALVRPLRWPRGLLFGVGVLVLLVTLAGPLDVIGERYLFSVHMLEHLVLIEVVPPLLIAGLPPEAVQRLLGKKLPGRAEAALSRPWAAWLVGILTLYAWHLPTLYNAALADERLHALQHLSFLVAATVFWWPVLALRPAHTMKPHVTMVYLAVAATANSVLGAVLTFGTPALYPTYTRPTDDSPALALIRDRWGVDPTSDLQLGGMSMWVLGGLFFLVAILLAYANWYRHSGELGIP